MKTAEEKAREASNDSGIDDIQHRTMFAPGYLQGYNVASNDSGIDDIQHRTMFAPGYLQGYNVAMRWRDPKEELPKDEQVLIKTDKDEILLVTYWVEKGDFVYWDAPVYNVISWRPIEESFISGVKYGRSSPKIKQLEWMETDEDGVKGIEAVTPFGDYEVYEKSDHDGYILWWFDPNPHVFDTEIEAKMYAQADFEKRVKGCLE